MKRDKIEKIRQQFLIQRDDLRDKLTKNNETELDVDGDEFDIATGATLAKLQEDLSIRLVKQIKSIDAALKRIADGIFGECEECGEDIAEKRLLAKPDATLCILCAEKIEYQAKQFRKE
jgi:DnaK suppressor protein